MTELIVTINIEWCTEDADLTTCDGCEDVMVTNTNGLYVFANNTLCSDEPVFKLCNSCFDVFNNII